MLVRVAVFAALGGFLYGYDLGLIGGAMLSMRDDFTFSEEATEVIVAAAKVGGIFGTFLGGGLMLYYGRRTTIALDSVFFMMGPIIMASASGITGLVAGRLLIGLGIGISAVVVPAYLGELAPAKVRGRIVEIYEVVLCVGMLAAVLADAALVHAPNNWRWMVGLPVVPGMILSAAMWMLPESPRWLVVDGRLDEALAVIHVIYTNDQLPAGVQESTADVEHELLELWSSVEKEKEAVNERAAAAQMARACKSRAAEGKQVRVQGRGSRWHMLQEVPSEQHERHALAGTGSVGSSAGISDRPPGPHRADGKAPPSPSVEVTVEAMPEASSATNLETIGTYIANDDALPGVSPVHTGVLQTPGDPSQDSSPEHGRALHRQLSDPTSPLYRSLSEIPQGLRPIRTTSFSTELGDSTPATPVARNDPHKSLRNAATVPRRRVNEKLVQQRPGFWETQRSVVVDMWRVLWGPESRAVRLALWIAIFDQAMASTAIVNYAPALIQQTALSSNSDATLWTGYVTGAKIVGSVAAMFLVDTAGRRPLLIWGSVLCGCALLVLGAADALHSPALMVAAMCAFILAFSASYAGVFWVLLSEIFSMSAKAPAASAATAVLFVAGALPDLIYLSLHSWLGPAAFLCFAGVAFAGALYCHVNLPETKGRTLAEVQVLLSKKRSAAERAGHGSLSGSPSHAAANGLTHAHEVLMRPSAGAAAGRAVAGRSHTHALAGDDDLMERGGQHNSQWGAHWLSRQWAGYNRFNPQEA